MKVPMHYFAGDIVNSTTGRDKHYVYALLGIGGKPYYIGITNNPIRRQKQHNDRVNVQQAHIRARAERLSDVVMVILSDACTRSEAKELEFRLIDETPGLCNLIHR